MGRKQHLVQGSGCWWAPLLLACVLCCTSAARRTPSPGSHSYMTAEALGGAQALNRVLTGVSTMLARGQIKPLPRTVYPLARVTEALREFAHARHVGKIVAAAPEELPREPWGAWVVTGGLGALGLLTGRWLLEHSAKRIVLLGRTGRSAA